jgi:hypothetical protein
MAMERVGAATNELGWLATRPEMESVTGYDPEGWEASTWVLHALYVNDALVGLGSHDELRRQSLASGAVAPVIIGDVNLDAVSTVTGTPLGFVVRPGSPWRRVRWAEYLGTLSASLDGHENPPSDAWFPHKSWPVSVLAPPEGSLDEESFTALVDTLAATGGSGFDAECLAFYASLPASDFDSPHLWRGRLGELETLLSDRGGPYSFTPTNFWPVDRSWFVWTDYDLSATKISGSRQVLGAVRRRRDLDWLDWTRPNP